MRNPLLWTRRAVTYPIRCVKWMSSIHQHGLPSSVLHFGGGIGDQLLLTCVARHLRQNGERCVWVASKHAELFAGNQDVSHVIPEITDDLCWLMRRVGGRVLSLHYAPHIAAERRDTPPAKHLLVLMCEQARIRGTVHLRPYLELSAEEKSSGEKVRKQVAIQVTGRSSQHFMLTKEWFPERFQQVVDQLKSRMNFVQIGHRDDPPLGGVLDLRGKTGIRETAAVLAASELFVGLVGFLMHLARAVDCPSVIIYGGRELPSQSGYSCNVNLIGQTACSPCWRYDGCAGQRACMDQITASQVIAAIAGARQRNLEPLEADQVEL